MPEQEIWTPQKAAIRLTKICDTFSEIHCIERFPVNVVELSLRVAELFQWDDPIVKIEPVDIKGFDGALIANEERSRWMLLYNNGLTSPGRIRFTQAHELGHYILHRLKRDEFKCSNDDMLSWEDKDIESEADLFASYLLMPFNDFRKQLTPNIDIDVLRQYAIRYGVSVTAAALKWLECTEENAVFILSRDGYMKWAFSSPTARRNGAFFRTQRNVVSIPEGSLAANQAISIEEKGIKLSASIWFPHAGKEASIREMKIHSIQYEYIITLLVLSKKTTVWPPFNEE